MLRPAMILQGLTAETNEQQQTVVRLQKNTAIACHDQLKEFGAALSHVRMQVRPHPQPFPGVLAALACCSPVLSR